MAKKAAKRLRAGAAEKKDDYTKFSGSGHNDVEEEDLAEVQCDGVMRVMQHLVAAGAAPPMVTRQLELSALSWQARGCRALQGSPDLARHCMTNGARFRAAAIQLRQALANRGGHAEDRQGHRGGARGPRPGEGCRCGV